MIKTSLSTNGARIIGCLHAPYAEIKWKLIIDLNVNCKTTKLLERKWIKFLWPWVTQKVLRYYTESMLHKRKIRLYKNEKLLHCERHCEENKKTSHKVGENIGRWVSNKGPSRVFKELLKLNNKKITQFLKLPEDLNSLSVSIWKDAQHLYH